MENQRNYLKVKATLPFQVFLVLRELIPSLRPSASSLNLPRLLLASGLYLAHLAKPNSLNHYWLSSSILSFKLMGFDSIEKIFRLLKFSRFFFLIAPLHVCFFQKFHLRAAQYLLFLHPFEGC